MHIELKDKNSGELIDTIATTIIPQRSSIIYYNGKSYLVHVVEYTFYSEDYPEIILKVEKLD
jgi:hypothetical protein